MEKPLVLLVTKDEQLVAAFSEATASLNLICHPLGEVPSLETLTAQWHTIVVDAEMPECEAIGVLALAHRHNPRTRRALVVAQLEPQELLRAVNEAAVHHVWVKPVSSQEVAKAFQREEQTLADTSFPLLLSFALESKGFGSHGHGFRVAHYAVAIGRQLGLSEERLRALQLGCLFHDIGKILLPDPLVLSQDELAAPAQFLEQQHPLWGEQVVQGLSLPEDALAVIRHHHERWDGQGFPDRLKGDAIPLPAQIAALANAYDHLTAPQAGTQTVSHAEINAMLEAEAGARFAPDVVRAFLSLRERKDVWTALEQVTDLPALTPIVHRALALLEREDFDWQAVAEVLMQDQNLVAQLLRVANSALTGLRRRVTSLTVALKMLGAKGVRNLLLTVSMRPFLRVPTELHLWEHSLACAIVARWLAYQTRLVDPEEAFTAGLLHDLGKSLLYRFFPQSYQRAINLALLQGCPIFLMERLVFSATHGEVGAWLLTRWRLPPSFCEAVATHHTPSTASNPLAWHLFWANRLLRAATEHLSFVPPELLRSLPVPLQTLASDPTQLTKIIPEVQEISKLLDE